MARATNALLRALDRYKDHAMIIGATNVGHALDPAVLRCFDEVVAMDEPNEEAYQKLIALRMKDYELSKEIHQAMLDTMIASEASLADADRLCDNVKKQVLMSFKSSAKPEDISTVVHTEHLTSALHNARSRKAVLLQTR